jgi:hypothetical protein
MHPHPSLCEQSEDLYRGKNMKKYEYVSNTMNMSLSNEMQQLVQK